MLTWSKYLGGSTIGERGSENGVILDDEEYASGARITLERDGDVAPFAITCGVYGLFVHTRFFSREDEARRECAEMKAELGRLVDLSSEVGEEEVNSMIMGAAERFVDRFPA